MSRIKRSTDEIVLPGDLWMDILSRIPIKSIGRFRCVSEFYRNLIDGPDFIKMHYDRSIKTRSSVIIQGGRDSGKINCEYLVDFDDTSKPTVNYIPRTFSTSDIIEDKTKLVGSCRGILCYSAMMKRKSDQLMCLILWNPVTGSYRRSSEHYDRQPALPPVYLVYAWCFLGYDAVTDDLKVLKIMHYKDKMRVYQVNDFAVYSSKTDSWKNIEGLPRKFSMGWYGTSDVFLEGINCVHILVRDDARKLRVLTFNFAVEEFNFKISLPPHCRDISYSEIYIGLISLDGCLCFYRNSIGSRGYLEVWMMKEYGVEKSWTRLFSLKPHYCMGTLFGGRDHVNNDHNLASHRGLVPRTFVNINGHHRQLLVSTSGCKHAGMYLSDAKEEEELKEVEHVRKLGLDWANLKTQHFQFFATYRQP